MMGISFTNSNTPVRKVISGISDTDFLEETKCIKTQKKEPMF